MPSSKNKISSKRQAILDDNLEQITKEIGRSNFTGQIHYHDGPSLQTNALGKITLTRVIPVVRFGANYPVEHHHLWKLRESNATESAWRNFEPNWRAQLETENPSLLGALWKTWRGIFLLAVLLQLVFSATQYALPVLMPYLIDWFIFAQFLPLWWVFVYAVAVCSAMICGSLFNYHCLLYSYGLGIRVRAVLITLVYRKALFTRLGRSQTSGMVVNLVATDAQMLLESMPFFMSGVLAPVQIAVTMGLLSRQIGPYCCISLAVAVLAAPLSGILASSLGFQMAQVQKRGDTRLKFVKEFLGAIRIVKYYAWEMPFLKNIARTRDHQLEMVRALMFSRSWLINVVTNIPGFGIGFTFFFYGLGHSMSFIAVFDSMVYLNMLAIPFIFLPMLISFSSQFYASLIRIQFFALRSELEQREILETDDPELQNSMSIKDASFAWETELGIAESKFMDLEAKEAQEMANINLAEEAEAKKAATEALKQAKAEKEWISQQIEKLKKKKNGIAGEEDEIEVTKSKPVDKQKQKAPTSKSQEESEYEVEEAEEEEAEESGEVEEEESEESESATKKTKQKKKREPTEDADSPSEVYDHQAVASGKDSKDKKDKKRKTEKAKLTFEPLRKPTTNLMDISFDVKPGKLTMIVGGVGSGKSTLAMAFLGELACLKGSVEVYGEMAYATQEAWILNATVRDNITFGSEYDPERYAHVVKACALTKDLASFPASDLTEIGERGINLSGGQKQRINVARAMYSSHPIVILDDPFSAVDAHVGDHMFKYVAKGMVEEGRTVLLITNQLHFVPEGDYIGVIKKGSIIEQGTYEQLMNDQGKLYRMINKQIHKAVEKTDEEDSGLRGSSASLKKSSTLVGSTQTLAASKEELREQLKASETILHKSLEVSAYEEVETKEYQEKGQEEVDFLPTPEKDEEHKKAGALIFIEEREEGNIGIRTYWDYLKSGGIFLFSTYVILRIIADGFQVFSGIWLSWWADPTNSHHITKTNYLGGYMGYILGTALFNLLASIVFVFFSISSGRKLHTIIMQSVSTAPTNWFDKTPIGRIIARFSKDISQIDLFLPAQVDQAVHFAVTLLGLFASVATGTAYILIILAVAFFAFGALTLHYRKTSIQVQRLEAISRAPILSHLTETLEGAVAIRCYKMTDVFKIANMNKVDSNNLDFMGLKFCSIWFALTLDMLGSITVFLSYVAMILVRYYIPNSVNVGYIIFAISSTNGISQSLAAVSTTITDLENRMNSAERILQYSVIPPEAPYKIPETEPHENWPEQGRIVLDNLYAEYKPGIPVLKGISCEIKPKEKIGIVGRTGAGKSTLITTLFRTIEPTSGTIHIDDVDITKIGLYDLRSKLSIIPQSPQLFVGTVRYNLDPFSHHTDDELWKVLKQVKLRNHVSEMDGKLEAQVDEGGSNFSVGQRQLLAMARCLLRETHVLLLDEATAAVDTETDALLQKMIRKNFKDKTVLTIAHRLNTIMDSDRIMVLDAGCLIEFDSPAKLLKNRKGLLYSLVEATGPESAAFLKAIAFGKSSVVDAIKASSSKVPKEESKDASGNKAKKEREGSDD